MTSQFASPLTSAERLVAETARGFMPTDEGLALASAAAAARPELGPFVEIGGYCGKSACYLGPAARQLQTVLFSVDHHRGSEENQPGWKYHEPDLVDADAGKIDTLPVFRRTVRAANLEAVVVPIVGDSATVASFWNRPLSLLFIDGGHGAEPTTADYNHWVPHVAPGGLLLIHDVFADPADGGQAPHDNIYVPALTSQKFVERNATGSLRILERTAQD